MFNNKLNNKLEELGIILHWFCGVVIMKFYRASMIGVGHHQNSEKIISCYLKN